MKITQLDECSTTSGSVAPVSQPMASTPQKRMPKGSNLLRGIKTSAKYANSLHEGTEKCTECGCASCECEKVEEGLGDTIKRGVKNIKSRTQGVAEADDKKEWQKQNAKPKQLGKTEKYFSTRHTTKDTGAADKEQGVAEGWKGAVAGGLAGAKGGASLGAMAGGPLGAGIGGLVGGIGGAMVGNEWGDKSKPKDKEQQTQQLTKNLDKILQEMIPELVEEINYNQFKDAGPKWAGIRAGVFTALPILDDSIKQELKKVSDAITSKLKMFGAVPDLMTLDNERNYLLKFNQQMMLDKEYILKLLNQYIKLLNTGLTKSRPASRIDPTFEQQGVAEGAEHNVGDTVNYSTKVGGFSKSAVGGQGKITKKTATHYTINGKEMPHSHIKSRTQGVAEGNDWSGPLYDPALQGNGKKQRYEMMFKNGQVKRFSAMNDNEARKIAAGHGAKSVIKLRGGVPAGKIAEQGVSEAAWTTPEERVEIEKHSALFKAALAAGNNAEMERQRTIIGDLQEKSRVAANTRGYRHDGPPPGWRLDELNASDRRSRLPSSVEEGSFAMNTHRATLKLAKELSKFTDERLTNLVKVGDDRLKRMASSELQKRNQGVAEDGYDPSKPANYTLGHAPDAEYVYSIYRDGEKEGTYHSIDQVKRIVANMKKHNSHTEYKVKRSPRNKMAGPVGQLPESSVAEAAPVNKTPEFTQYVYSKLRKNFSDPAQVEDLFDYAYLSDVSLGAISDAMEENGTSAKQELKERLTWLLNNMEDRKYRAIIKPIAVEWIKLVAPILEGMVDESNTQPAGQATPTVDPAMPAPAAAVAPESDPEIRSAEQAANVHYSSVAGRNKSLEKFLLRSLKHAKDTDAEQTREIRAIKRDLDAVRKMASKGPVAEGEITEDDVVLSADRRKPKSGLLSKPEQAMNPADTVKLDVPLLIRLLEFAKEDAADDMALHDLAEKLVAQGARGRTLTMKDYDNLVPSTPEAPAPDEEQEDFEGKFNQEMDEVCAPAVKSYLGNTRPHH